MFRQAQRKSDLEGNHGGHVTRDMLDFRDPSWIIEHHRRSIITKIYKPGESWLDVLFGQRSETNTDSYHNRERPRDGHSPQAVTDEIPLGLSSQQSKGGTGTIHAQLGGSEQSYRINFSELQRLRLRQLQHKLVQHAIDLRYDAMEPSGWAEDLREYGKAHISQKQLHAPCLLLMQFHDSPSPARFRIYGKIHLAAPRPVHRNWRATY